ncbi:hypothetical protein PLEOSDRAFT_174079 [Pleurotus ostreatus PC15]|uniref:Uncharacterized protein n=1 Tax=Pleurotus ostreatus (strain PC15) TaxID=1137138 RepID=A0A067NSP5_PLEO1|nr:hypothetical protein PLEOSDRAFT_174079 [Pleurotus ostreatus PC15]
MNSPASSVSSILLAELPWGDNSLLDETLTLDTLSDTNSLSSNSPAINQGLLGATPKPINSFRKHSIYASRPLAKRITPAATVSVCAPAQPNAPEGLSVKDWAQSLVPSDPPDHVPWGDGEDNAYVIADADDAPGGLRAPHILVENPPSPFRARHDGLHLKVPKNGDSSDSYLRSTAPLTIRRDRKRNRAPTNKPINELFFEREISLSPGSGGRTERLSLQIPTATMSPELVDLMLELHNLKTFFQEPPGGAKAPNSKPPQKAPRSNEQEDTKAPTLILSDSHSAFPIPLSRPGSDASLKGPLSACRNTDTSGTTPIAIAARRGRKMLAPLAVQSTAIGDSSDIMYPGMPTAFLGTPSAYSPHSGMPLSGPAGNCAPPAPPNGLDIQGMIESLRGQCAAFPATPNTPNYPTQTPSEPLPPLPSDVKAQPEKRKRRRASEAANPKKYRPRQGNTLTRQDTLASLSAGLDAGVADSSNIYFGQDLAKSTASFHAVKSSRSSHWDLDNVTRPKAASSARASLSMVSPPSPNQQQKNRRRTMAIVGDDRIGEWAASQNFSESPSKVPDVPRSALRHTSSPPPNKPSHQSRASSVSSTYAPRGILRNRKSVRFASLPGRKSNSVECTPRPSIDQIGSGDYSHQDQTQDRRRGGRVSLPTLSSARERKACRQVKDSTSDATSTIHPSSVPSHPTSLSSKSRNSATSDGQKLIPRRRHTFTPTPELRSQPPSNATQDPSSRTRSDRSVFVTSPTPTKHRPPPVVRSTRTTTITPRKSVMTIEEQMPVMRQTGSQLSPQKTPRLCRKSMAPTIDPDYRSSDKENRGLGRASLAYPSPISFHNGGNQTAARKERSMSVDEYDSKGSKGKGASRMPVPLRNILTRFK